MTNIAIAGLGNVGAGVIRLLKENADLIAQRAGQPITVKAVCARDKNKKRDCDLANVLWVEDAHTLTAMGEVDVVVELIGGVDGIAHSLAKATLSHGKHLVTANKALLATHGIFLAQLAESNNVQLHFEAAVAGGIPILKTIREGLAGNKISILRGILNGTCNYILTRMEQAQLSFDAALKEAQTLGYAEADSTADIGGFDTANKLAILTSLAFGSEPELSSIQIDGIRRITALDIKFASELGCRIKLLGVARQTTLGIEQHVGPSLVPKTSPLAAVSGALNAVMVKGNFVNDIMLEGQGAGADPTASAVVADLIDIARGNKGFAFGLPARQLKQVAPATEAREARYYIRLQVIDKPGVVADITAILRDEVISIESLLQRGKSVTESVPVVITTHVAQAQAMRNAVEKIARLPTVVERPCLLQIED